MTALSSRNFPKNPASGGMPASETIASVIVAASSGERWFKPARAAECLRRRAAASPAQMTVNAAEHGEQIAAQVIRARPIGLTALSAATPSSR